MRIAHLSDSHLATSLDLDDNVRVHDAALRALDSRRPELILHAGDVYDGPPTRADRLATFAFFSKLAEIAPVVVVRGNHDPKGEVQLLGMLRGVTACETPEVVEVDTAADVDGLRSRATVIALPWFNKATIAKEVPPEMGIEVSDQAAVDVAREVLQALEGVAMAGDPLVVVGLSHVSLGGAQVSSGQELIGEGVELAPADFQATGSGIWFLGHIHKAQTWSDPGWVGYSGSLQRLNFGEPEEKGIGVVEVQPNGAGGEVVGAEMIALPAKKLVRLEWTAGMAAAVLEGAEPIAESAGQLRDADLRIRIRGDVEALDRLDLPHLEDVAVSEGVRRVKVETIAEREDRVRSEAIRTASSTWEMVQAYLTSKGVNAPPARLERLRALLDEIEEAKG